MLASFDRKTKEANIISIPRDTYYKGINTQPIQKCKINAVYGSEEDGYKAL